MKILVGKTFGIGNAVMAIPMLKGILSLGHEVDVLVGTTPDDGGASQVFSSFRDYQGTLGHIFFDFVPLDREYDLAIMAIPFDGRWREGTHFRAKEVWDGRTRPDPSTTGLISWKKHEVEYQWDHVVTLGGDGTKVAACDFLSFPQRQEKTYYLGVGYKKDEAGFWKVKHWGNENFIKLARLILDEDPENKIFATGDIRDMQLSLGPIARGLNFDRRFVFSSPSLHDSFITASRCECYVGNDTGMMHVAAASGSLTLGLFFLENSIVKSRPWGPGGFFIDGVGRQVSSKEVFEKLKEIRDDQLPEAPA